MTRVYIARMWMFDEVGIEDKECVEKGYENFSDELTTN